MKLKFFAPIWGFDQLPLEEYLDKICAAGYQGIEMIFPRESVSKQTRNQQVELIKSKGLELITQHYETVVPDFSEHKKELKSRLLEHAETQPIFINSQTGREFFEFDQCLELIDLMAEVENETGVKIVHETHRGRFNFAAHLTAKYVKQRPSIKQTADFSHFCCVAGNLLEDQKHNIDLIIPTIHHIHTRVGFSEGPQVTRPDAPEYESELRTHLSWWMQILASAKNRGMESFTLMTEFGPPPYMPTKPFTQEPLADQWSVNQFIKDRIIQAYSN